MTLVDIGRLRAPQGMGAEGAWIGARNASPALDQLAVVFARQWLSLVTLQSGGEVSSGSFLLSPTTNRACAKSGT